MEKQLTARVEVKEWKDKITNADNPDHWTAVTIE